MNASIDATKIVKDMTQKMNNCVDHVLKEFSTIHTGKASPAMVENVMVDAYGSAMRMKEIAAIMTPDPRCITIQPWDKSMLQEISKVIQKANVGLNPVIDGAHIRCPIPELSGERRSDLIKVTHTMAEDGRIAIRSARRDAIDTLKKEQKAGSISEDDLVRYEKEIQHITDKHNNEIATHLVKKEQELKHI